MADKKWEYEVEEVRGGVIDAAFLNRCGDLGWELVSILSAGVPAAPSMWLFFKREKAPDYAFLNSPAIESALALGPDGKFLNPDPGAQRPEPASGEGPNPNPPPRK